MIGQLEVLGPLVTDRVRELVRDRLLHGLKFFDGHTLRPQFKKADVKLALLLVRIANPKELLSKDEADLIESGMHQKCTRHQDKRARLVFVAPGRQLKAMRRNNVTS